MIRNKNSHRHGVADELDSLKDDMSRLRQDLAGLAEALLRLGRTEAGDAKDHIAKEAQKGIAGLRSAVNGARNAGSQAIDTIEEQITDRPVTSLIIAFAAGLIFGKVMNRS